MTPLDYLVIGLYLTGTLVIGTWFSRGQKSLKEFFLGAKNIPWWAAAFSGIATMVSGVSFLGGPGQAFKSNFNFLQYRLATPMALAVICLLLIPFFHKLELYSAYEYLERRFNAQTRTLASSLFLLLRVFYTGIVIYAPSLVLAQMTGLPLVWIVLATGLFTTLYTTLGGMRAVIWTDTLQLFVLLGGLITALAALAAKTGGFGTMLAQASALGKLEFFNYSTDFSTEVSLWGGLIGGTFFMVSQYGVDQAELQRFLTTENTRKSQLAMISSMLTGVAIGFLLFTIGAGLFVFYTQHAGRLGADVHPDRVFAQFIIEELPAGLKGLLIAGLFAGSMSAISGVLNSLTTVLFTDFVHSRTKHKASVNSARAVTVSFGLICTAIAMFADRFGTILAATSKLTNFFGGTLVGIFLLGILVERANGRGAFLGALSGFTAVLALSALTTVSWMWYGAFSAVVAFTSGLLWSLLFPAQERAKLAGLTWASRRTRKDSCA